MYEKVFGLFLLGIYIISALIFYYKGRRKGITDNIPGVEELERRAADDIRGAGADNNLAKEQNRQLRDNCQRAAELIKRGEEILGMGQDNQ